MTQSKSQHVVSTFCQTPESLRIDAARQFEECNLLASPRPFRGLSGSWRLGMKSMLEEDPSEMLGLEEEQTQSGRIYKVLVKKAK